MDLFASAGMDVPSGRRGAPPRRSPGPRTLRVPLFNYRVVEDARGKAAFAPTPEQLAAARDYARRAKGANFIRQKETGVRPLLFGQVFGAVLGYTEFDPDAPYTLSHEHPIRNGSADAALGRFTGEKSGEVFAPCEVKGPGNQDLDAVPSGSLRSPVQQGWDYAIDAPGSRWVIVTNCVELRLYAFGRGRDAYHLFDLSKLDDPEEHERLWLLLSAERLLGGATDALLRQTDSAYKDVSAKLYTDYKALRDRLIAFLTGSADGPKLTTLAAIPPAQKILDRILFIAFAQRTGLISQPVLEEAAKAENPFAPVPRWSNFKGLFRWCDTGYLDRDIEAFNGGLFAPDPILDTVEIPDPLVVELAGLAQWDYRSDVPVTILGHIFEQSVTDLEKLRAESLGQAPPDPKNGTRKRQGIVYTPETVTRFLIERTIELTLREREAALLAEHANPEAIPVSSPAAQSAGKGIQDGARSGSPSPAAAPPPPAGDDKVVRWRHGEASETAFWRAYLDVLRDLTVLDPACGSGAFLVAAFDALAAEYRRVTERLAALGEPVSFDPLDWIVTRNLHGVDLNAESVEITRLSLWLKTARRKHKLQNLEATIKVGDSLIASPGYTRAPFDWDAAFPDVVARGGFDVVIGNPPYVRMEFLKAVKPYLERHYRVAADRTDLYAYFFEKGVSLLKPGGRLGYISSSTFFRTGSGEKLRALLAAETEIEAVLDYGDEQIFEGVTTYPAILTLRKPAGLPLREARAAGTPTDVMVRSGEAASRTTHDAPVRASRRASGPPQHDERDEAGDHRSGHLRFLKLAGPPPKDLGAAFEADAVAMPRARLGSGSWQFEEDALARLRAKIVTGRKTLGEVYGAPMRGIVTGLNEAFVIDRPTRDRLVAADPRSAELLKPFLRGEDVKRWRVEPQGLFLINTPKGKVDIEAYPAIRDWLLPFKDKLEARATKQEWWELQQAQLAYQSRFGKTKLVYPIISQGSKFSPSHNGEFVNDKVFMLPFKYELLGLLNSKAIWFFLFGVTSPLRGGQWRLELREQYVSLSPIPQMTVEEGELVLVQSEIAARAAAKRLPVIDDTRRRIGELAPGRKLSGKLERWWELDFAGFPAEVKHALNADIPLRRRGEWQGYLDENREAVRRLTAEIEAAEREIDRIVYRLFDLTPDEITLLETSLDGQT